jgi:hypothetical protein
MQEHALEPPFKKFKTINRPLRAPLQAYSNNIKQAAVDLLTAASEVDELEDKYYACLEDITELGRQYVELKIRKEENCMDNNNNQHKLSLFKNKVSDSLGRIKDKETQATLIMDRIKTLLNKNC